MKLNALRHSLAHIMALAAQNLFGKVKFGIGPAIENGFYYDFNVDTKQHELEHETTRINPGDLPKIEKEMKKIIKQNIPFIKEELEINEAIKLFKKIGQNYKVELLEDLKKYGTTEHEELRIMNYESRITKQNIKKFKSKTITIYKTGDFIDLCRGPHVKSTGEIPSDAFKLTKIAGAYWRGDEKRPMLQRIYGVAFENKEGLNRYIKLKEEMEKRDHRALGQKLDLFSFHDFAPGAAFWHPKGMIIIKELERVWREIHDKAGYQETSTPILVKNEIFKKSGHWEHYRENMFFFENEGEIYTLKPMNCPESTYIYSSKIRSWRDLPIRLSEIGRLHRNELSGTLTGLFRVRQITMDDAHIYSRPNQILEEVTGILNLIKEFYKIFKLEPSFYFSTRPKDAMGSPKIWKKAENALEYALKKNKLKYEIKTGDGAFYGPKIDIEIKDILGREWQVSTIQLDFQMPEKFELSYIDEKGRKQRPVMIHRAIFGSFERFIGILLEHYTGALPLWLSPIQIYVIPVGSRHEKYAEFIGSKLSVAGFRVEVKNENETVSKKIREGEIQKIPYMLVVGDKEEKTKQVRVRDRQKGDIGLQTVDKFIQKIIKDI